LILPHHLQHSLQKGAGQPTPKIRQQFADAFERLSTILCIVADTVTR
jgi:hypothetical protein